MDWSAGRGRQDPTPYRFEKTFDDVSLARHQTDLMPDNAGPTPTRAISHITQPHSHHRSSQSSTPPGVPQYPIDRYNAAKRMEALAKAGASTITNRLTKKSEEKARREGSPGSGEGGSVTTRSPSQEGRLGSRRTFESALSSGSGLSRLQIRDGKAETFKRLIDLSLDDEASEMSIFPLRAPPYADTGSDVKYICEDGMWAPTGPSDIWHRRAIPPFSSAARTNASHLHQRIASRDPSVIRILQGNTEFQGTSPSLLRSTSERFHAPHSVHLSSDVCRGIFRETITYKAAGDIPSTESPKATSKVGPRNPPTSTSPLSFHLGELAKRPLPDVREVPNPTRPLDFVEQAAWEVRPTIEFDRQMELKLLEQFERPVYALDSGIGLTEKPPLRDGLRDDTKRESEFDDIDLSEVLKRVAPIDQQWRNAAKGKAKAEGGDEKDLTERGPSVWQLMQQAEQADALEMMTNKEREAEELDTTLTRLAVKLGVVTPDVS
eukprot:GHVN01008384.1.p1 GENE.GHVN01008384.1~~GHVN01008384.1.p1  ORF type:complete len:492 (-),score=120.39 GHVN01008384.1:491-1966(-)